MSHDLTVLVRHRDALLLAEIAAWLHMIGKFHEKFLEGNHSLDIEIPNDVREDFPQITHLLEDSWTGNIWATLDVAIPKFNASGLSIFKLIDTHREHRERDKRKNQERSKLQESSGFLRLMCDAHGRGSGTEKGVLAQPEHGQKEKVFLSTSLGNEGKTYIDLIQIQKERKCFYEFIEQKLSLLKLRDTQLGKEEWLDFRQDFLREIIQFFQMTVAETRRPLNDVTLFDQTLASVAFFKAALAQNLLVGWQEPSVKNATEQYRWRFLRIGLDGLMFWGNSVRISDLLARRKLVEQILDSIQVLLEVTLPLGFEIYRDENGSVFIVPDIQDLLDKAYSDNEKTLKEYIQEIAYQILSGETNLSLDLSCSTRNMLLFGELVTKELPHPRPSLQWLKQEWQGEEKRVDICPVCGLRPQGPTKKALNRKVCDEYERGRVNRKVCDECERGRVNRSKEWLEKRSSTIWIDEVSDINGRFALLVAQYGIVDWLSGSAFNTILTFDPQKRQLVNKTNSKNFDLPTLIADIQEGLKGNTAEFNEGSLLAWLVQKKVRGYPETIQNFYNIRIDGTDLASATALSAPERLVLSLLRQPPSFARIKRTWETSQAFWQKIASDFKAKTQIGEISSRLQIRGTFQGRGESLGIFHTYELKLGNVNLSITRIADDEFLTVDNLQRTWILLNAPNESRIDYSSAARDLRSHLLQAKSFDLEEPTGYGSPNKVLGKFQIIDVDIESTPYVPAISILTEPRTFMAIVPADKALGVAKAIREKYEKEMGKVQNRLPLTLGIVFAGRRTPLPAILDAGRRMLRQPIKDETRSISKIKWEINGIEQDIDEVDKSLWPQKVKLTFLHDKHSSINVSTVMGDGEAKDVWFPYWCLEKERENANARERLFKSIDGKNWTHIKDLQVEDTVSFRPSRFDFEFLDTAARRFEVSYENGKRRGWQRPSRPYYLEQLESFEWLWNRLSDKTRGLTTSQIHNLIGIIETKRMEWVIDQKDASIQETFERFVGEVLNDAEWKRKQRPSKEDMERLHQAAVSGQLADVVELYIRILKVKEDGGENS